MGQGIRHAAAARKSDLEAILPLRALFLQETNFQIRYDACHKRGWSDSYLLLLDDLPVGYGSVKGRQNEDRDAVFEYFVVPPFRNRASELFQQLLAVSGAGFIQCQSNDLLLTSMLYEFSPSVSADVVLFEDHSVTGHAIAGAAVRPRREDDRIFEHAAEPVGDYVVEHGGEVVASGGFLRHYNPPFADLYMEVRPDCRSRGIGSFLLQEIKRECYLAGRVPAARCDIRNAASRAALLKAGLRVCGFMLTGKVAVRR
ncbi:MAG TPA: GNAT family N-acetyltransferase [Bryobacteraceae bacterium]|nr:GNAT family N-acetyltransferase [Bryobacteraceae bacterium]